MLREYTWKEYRAAIDRVTKEVNALFVNAKPLEMEMQCIMTAILLIKKKNYIMRVLDNMDNPEVCKLVSKGVKYKKKGTSPLCKTLGENCADLAILNKNPEAALDLVRSKIIALKKRTVTLTDLIYTHTYNTDPTIALYQYMVKCKQHGNYPPKETEEEITKRYQNAIKSMTVADKKNIKKSNATPAVVYAYRELCKDCNAWVERGTTIHYIFMEGTYSAKRDMVCSISDAINMDIPYNINIYKDEVMRVTRKVMAFIVGDIGVGNTPIYNKLILNHPSVSTVSHRPHVSFFDAQYGTKTVKTEGGIRLESQTDDAMCNKTVLKLIEKNSETVSLAPKKMNSYYAYSFIMCSSCHTELKPDESRVLCKTCISKYDIVLKESESELSSIKKQMDSGWKTCKTCLNRDEADPLDCSNWSCFNFTSRLDATKEYYKAYQRHRAIRGMGDNNNVETPASQKEKFMLDMEDFMSLQ
jgi:Zn finger protein HypA/HybF involved in hydrogenase expression